MVDSRSTGVCRCNKVKPRLASLSRLIPGMSAPGLCGIRLRLISGHHRAGVSSGLHSECSSLGLVVLPA